MSERELEKARAEASLAKDRLLGSVHTLHARLRPASLASTVLDGAREKGEEAVERASRFASEQPVAASAAAAGTLVFLFRRPIARLFKRRKAASPDNVSSDRPVRRFHGD